MNPLFSIIVPVYNVEKYIAKCIKSIQAQTFRDFEIICVDDCGQDNSIKIVEELAKNDPQIKIIYQTENKGLGAARNTALKMAKGRYVVCVDSDDFVEDTLLGKVYEAFTKNNVDSVWFKFVKYDDKTKKKEIFIDGDIFLCLFQENHLFVSPENMHYWPLYSWNKVFKRDLLLNNNIFWERNIIYEDIPLYYKYYINFPRVYIINEYLYSYRSRENSIVSSGNVVNKCSDFYVVLLIIAKYMKKNMFINECKDSLIELGKSHFNGFKHCDKETYQRCKNIFDNFSKKINSF